MIDVDGSEKNLVTRGYQGLPGVTRGYQGLPGVTRGYQGGKNFKPQAPNLSEIPNLKPQIQSTGGGRWTRVRRNGSAGGESSCEDLRVHVFPGVSHGNREADKGKEWGHLVPEMEFRNGVIMAHPPT
jgi:hypothetical protein